MKTFLAALALLLATPTVVSCSMQVTDTTQSGPVAEARQAATDRAATALSAESPLRRVVFAGGCFWCTEIVFESVQGVKAVVSGYAGGQEASATYDKVSAGVTDHAEAIQITYDPEVVTHEQLLDVFFEVAHDPTQLDRQGPDRGRQYRSAVFYADAAERALVEAHIKGLEKAKTYAKPIVTTLEPLAVFFPAEDYHQDFVRRNPRHGYVVVNALPKVKKLEKRFPALVKPKAAESE